MSKGGGSSTTVQKADPWGGVQPYLTELYAKTNEGGQSTLPFFPGQTYAGFDPLQQQGMQGMLDYSKDVVQPGVRGYQGSLSQYMNAPLNISQDPAVQAMMASNQQNATDWLTRSALPSINSGAVAAGQLGGSRQGIAQGLAAGEASKALTQANVQTMLGAYGDATKLAGVGASLMPGAYQLGMSPYETQMSVGGMQQGMTQQGINEAMSRYYYPETSLWDTLGKQASIYSGAQPFGSSTSSASGSGNSAAGALAGGMLGYSAYSPIASSLMAAGPTTAGTSALLGLGPLGFGIGGALLGGLLGR